MPRRLRHATSFFVFFGFSRLSRRHSSPSSSMPSLIRHFSDAIFSLLRFHAIYADAIAAIWLFWSAADTLMPHAAYAICFRRCLRRRRWCRHAATPDLDVDCRFSTYWSPDATLSATPLLEISSFLPSCHFSPPCRRFSSFDWSRPSRLPYHTMPFHWCWYIISPSIFSSDIRRCLRLILSSVSSAAATLIFFRHTYWLAFPLRHYRWRMPISFTPPRMPEFLVTLTASPPPLRHFSTLSAIVITRRRWSSYWFSRWYFFTAHFAAARCATPYWYFTPNGFRILFFRRRFLDYRLRHWGRSLSRRRSSPSLIDADDAAIIEPSCRHWCRRRHWVDTPSSRRLARLLYAIPLRQSMLILAFLLPPFPPPSRHDATRLRRWSPDVDVFSHAAISMPLRRLLMSMLPLLMPPPPLISPLMSFHAAALIRRHIYWLLPLITACFRLFYWWLPPAAIAFAIYAATLMLLRHWDYWQRWCWPPPFFDTAAPSLIGWILRLVAAAIFTLLRRWCHYADYAAPPRRQRCRYAAMPPPLIYAADTAIDTTT